MRVGRQPEHHGDAARARQPAGEHLAAAGIGAVIADIVEQQSRPGAGALRQPRNGAELDIPIDLGVDLLQFAGALERLHPAAQIAKRNRLSFTVHKLSRSYPAEMDGRFAPSVLALSISPFPVRRAGYNRPADIALAARFRAREVSNSELTLLVTTGLDPVVHVELRSAQSR